MSEDLSSSSVSDPLDTRDDEGWEDAASDQEKIEVKSFFTEQIFPDSLSMIQDCKANYGFDFCDILQRFDLDFYESIKLVNFIRSETRNGNIPPVIESKAQFEDEKYLQPTLEDDALLFSLDELREQTNESKTKPADTETSSSLARIAELELQLQRLQSQFSEYRESVARTLDQRWEDVGPPNVGPGSSTTAVVQPTRQEKHDTGYFESYSYNEIHETMLKDSVRTDAYRDFVYDHKHLFADKIVLDIGCGTGILSMFCARAGAAKVIAVDNSAIINKARSIVYANGLQEKITCLHGKIEEVILPVDKVDIIISEWMGYCLLFEAMLDSVLWARDRYLRPGGLMVPSHCTLRLAPISDENYIADNIDFWRDVYGFDMSAMMDKIHDDVLVRQLEPSLVVGEAMTFMELPLHTITVKDLEFVRNFTVTLRQDVEALDGWAIWFDTFFLPSADAVLPPGTCAEKWDSHVGKGIAFTTGPYGKETHWRSGVMLVDRAKLGKIQLREGSQIQGTVAFRKGDDNVRALRVGVTWEAQGCEEKGAQSWVML